MNHINLDNKRILISRTDSIGDVMLTLPICQWIKEHFTHVEVIFLGKNYTLPILKSFQAIDLAISWDDIQKMPEAQQISTIKELNADTIIHVFPNKEIAQLAKKAGIPNRIGTSHRLFHLFTCNHRVNFTRKRSDKHESQLNFELLRPFGLTQIPTSEEINALTKAFSPQQVDLPEEIEAFISTHPDYVILHPKSQGSALEWPMEKYAKLTRLMNAENLAVAFTGTEKEGVLFRGSLPGGEQVVDTSGKMTLEQLLVFIQRSKGLVACSTGPLHIAGFTGVKAIGLFSSRKPIHPGRWQAIGSNTKAIVYDEDCHMCGKGMVCKCIENIAPEKVMTSFLEGLN